MKFHFARIARLWSCGAGYKDQVFLGHLRILWFMVVVYPSCPWRLKLGPGPQVEIGRFTLLVAPMARYGHNGDTLPWV